MSAVCKNQLKKRRIHQWSKFKKMQLFKHKNISFYIELLTFSPVYGIESSHKELSHRFCFYWAHPIYAIDVKIFAKRYDGTSTSK